MLNKQIIFTGVHKAELSENEVGKVKENEILVKTEYTVVSGGTERACILGMNNTSQNFPMSLGYCGVGYAEENEDWIKKEAILKATKVLNVCLSLKSSKKATPY